MLFVEFIGYFAALLTTSAFAPQAVRIWKTKSAEDISLATFLMFLIGTISWLTFGIMMNSLPIILANLFTMILAIIILYFKIKYG